MDRLTMVLSGARVGDHPKGGSVSPTRRKIPVGPGGPLVDAELIDVQQASEQWSQYLLADGTVVKLKVIVTEVWKVVGAFDNDGNPQYVIRSGNIVTINAPDELRKQS